jgi:hypothetical protein
MRSVYSRNDIIRALTRVTQHWLARFPDGEVAGRWFPRVARRPSWPHRNHRRWRRRR